MLLKSECSEVIQDIPITLSPDFMPCFVVLGIDGTHLGPGRIVLAGTTSQGKIPQSKAGENVSPLQNTHDDNAHHDQNLRVPNFAPSSVFRYDGYSDTSSLASHWASLEDHGCSSGHFYPFDSTNPSIASMKL